MKSPTNEFLMALVLVFNATALLAEEIKILNVYRDQIVLYSESGEKMDIIDSSIIEAPANKTEVGIINKEEGLINITYGKDTERKNTWIKISAVQLSQPVSDEACPEHYASSSEDQTTPASSGWGCVNSSDK
jgi:hypothetical protein